MSNFATIAHKAMIPSGAYRQADPGPEASYNTYRFVGRIAVDPNAPLRSARDVQAEAAAKYNNPHVRVFFTTRWWVVYLP